MSQIFFSLIAGIVQGLTEFLPVSSSGHLILLHDWLGFEFVDNVAFDVVLHWGTLFALLFFFWADVLKYLKAFFSSLKKWNLKQDLNQRLAWYIVVATIPAAVAGYYLQSDIETAFRSPSLIAIMLIIFGFVLYLADHFSTKVNDMSKLSFGNAIMIGIAQSVALVPGVSRSGITIIAGLSQKLNRETAARFSFLLSMPIIFGAGLKKIIDLFKHETVMPEQWLVLLVGFFGAVVSGYLVIKYFLRFVQNNSLNIFVVYRIALGLIILALVFSK